MFGPRELEVFVAVIDAGSITRAAARLFRSQPTVSRQLATLERQVGSQLFRRTTGGMTLTPARALRGFIRHQLAELFAADAVSFPGTIEQR